MVAEDTSTKVYYHLDDSTPYMSVVPVPADDITLGDFKKVFTRRGYTYFCKEFDSALKVEVKVEITSDSEKLHKSANGHIELFLLSQSGAQGPSHFSSIPSSGTLPRTKGRPTSSTTVGFPVPTFKLSKRRSSALALSSIVDEMDVCGGQRVSMVTNERSMSGEASSDINTFISKRAGEHMAELYTSTSEDPYKFDVNSAPSFTSSNNYRPLLNSTNYTIQEDDDDDGGSSTVLQHSNNFHYNMEHNFRQRKPRKQRYRKPYVPSTISSASESSLGASLPRVDEVKIRMQDGLPMGISVACHDGGVFISKILPDSAADRCGRLEIGDQIVQVQKISFEELSDEQAVDQLYRASRLKGTVTIYVAKRPRISDQKSDALSLLCETMQMDVSLWVEQTTKQDELEPVEPFEELIHDELTSGNIASNKNNAILGIGNNNKICTANSNKTTYNFGFPSTSNGLVTSSDQGDVTSDEERAAYADRRNGFGPMLVPALHQSKKRAAAAAAIQNAEKHHQQELHHQQQQRTKKQQQRATTMATNRATGGSSTHSQEEDAVVNFRSRVATERRKNDENNDILNIGMDPITILKRMAKPDSGLIIKDRKWLKIPVPNSFIGDEMVNWLMENVTGFRDRKAAKAYASILLSNGYIKHVVNMMNFNEKCYYIFEDSIISERLRLLQQPVSQSTLASSTATTSTRVGGNSGGTTESTTEITYMSSPSSPFLMMNKNNGNMNKLNNNNISNINKTNNNPNTLQLPSTMAAACQSSATVPGIVKMANNPRYVSPPTHIIRNELAMRMTDANNNSMKITNGKMLTTANDPNLGGRGGLNTTWPISPISMFGNLNNINNNLRDCDSPAVTNDYASMIQGEINGGAQFDTLDVVGLRPKENNPPGQLPPIPPPISNIHNNNNANNSSLQKSLPSQQQNLF